VNKIRDFSSGILKQLANVLKMLRNMSWSRLRFRRFGGFADDHFTRAAFGLDLGLGRGTECVRAHRELPGQFTLTENFDAIGAAIGQTGGPQRGFIHTRAIVKLIQFADVHRDELLREPGVIEPALGDAPDERHLTALKTDADGTARTGRLALATAPAGLAVAAGFALAKSFAPMLRTGTRFQIV
jgi:hypothetical protein